MARQNWWIVDTPSLFNSSSDFSRLGVILDRDLYVLRDYSSNDKLVWNPRTMTTKATISDCYNFGDPFIYSDKIYFVIRDTSSDIQVIEVDPSDWSQSSLDTETTTAISSLIPTYMDQTNGYLYYAFATTSSIYVRKWDIGGGSRTDIGSQAKIADDISELFANVYSDGTSVWFSWEEADGKNYAYKMTISTGATADAGLLDSTSTSAYIGANGFVVQASDPIDVENVADGKRWTLTDLTKGLIIFPKPVDSYPVKCLHWYSSTITGLELASDETVTEEGTYTTQSSIDPFASYGHVVITSTAQGIGVVGYYNNVDDDYTFYELIQCDRDIQ